MTPAGRQLARLARRPRGLWECPLCDSRFVQPLSWDALPTGEVALELRCPECASSRTGSFPAEQVRELDRVLVRGRSELRAIYMRTLRDNMYRELAALHAGLELDLIGADDFAPRGRQASRFASYQA